jgi:hypothetical protein
LASGNRAGAVIGDTAIQHRLRRTICKGWRNKAMARSPYGLFSNCSSDDAPCITVPLADTCAITFDARPVLFTSPVTTALPDTMEDDAEESDDSTLGLFNRRMRRLMELPENPSKVIHIDEPELSFGHGQTCDHPKDGLFLYGPHSAPVRSREVSVGVIGTKDGLSVFSELGHRSWRLRGRPAAQEDRQGEPTAPLEFSRSGRSVRHHGQSR